MSESPKEIDCDYKMVYCMKLTVMQWAKTWNVKCRKRFNEKELEDMEKLITAEEMKSFDRSKAVRRAISLIDQYSSLPRQPSM